MSKNDPLNHLQWVLRVVAMASQRHFLSLCYCGCFHASPSLLFPLRMFHPQLISSFSSHEKFVNRCPLEKKERIGKERKGIKNEINKTKMKSWTVVPWAHMPAQLFLAAGTEPGDMSCCGQGGTDRERERERKTFMRAVPYQGVRDYSWYFSLQPITSAALEAALIYRVQT